MRNMLRMLESANDDGIRIRGDELGINFDIFSDVAKRCGFNVNVTEEQEGANVKLKKRGILKVNLFDTDESNRFDFLDIADLHVGNPHLDVDTLKRVLDSFTNRETSDRRYIFIAGDLVEGVTEDYLTYELVQESHKIREEVEETRHMQIEKLVSILRQYDASFLAINGNHEYTYEQLGLPSVLKEVEDRMKKKGVDFTFYDTYIVDFFFAGVVKRMMHLESYMVREGASHSYDRLLKFKEHGGLNPRYCKVKYPIRFFTCGHIHKRELLYDNDNKVYVSQPGSFLTGEMFYKPGIHLQGIVLPDKRILLD